MNESNRGDPTTAWMHVIAILTAAADTAPPSGADPDLHSLALGAQIVASRALAILPPEVNGNLEDVVIDLVASTTVGGLIRAAGAAAPRDPAAGFFAGAAAVLTELDALVAEVEVVR